MGTKKEDSVNEAVEQTAEQALQEISDLVDAAMGKAEALLREQLAAHDKPFEAFVTLVLTISVLSRAMRMDHGTLLEGVSAAYISLEEVEVPHVH